jgi:CPA2 family monovalent cation:H+ antiporter-2
MRLIVGWNSRELFLLSVAALGLGVGYLTYLFGLSFAFGAFVAGMVISESDYSYQALSDIIPLRDLFSLVFFTSIGMLLDPRVLVAEVDAVLLMVVLIAIGKIVIFGGITRVFGYGNVAPFAIGLTMFQLGEFSFVLASEGLNNGAFSAEQYSLILNAAIITLVLTPFLSRLADPIYNLRKRLFDHEPLMTCNLPQEGLQDHVVIVGHGRIGRYVADTLRRFDRSFVIIEIDNRRYELAREAGFPTIYGDATYDIVLQTANLETARLLIDTVPSVVVTHMIADHVTQMNPQLHIVARVDGMEDMVALRDKGLHELVQPQFEAGMEIARQALLHLGISSAEIQHFSDRVREKHYAPMYVDHPEYPTVAQMQTASRMMNFCWVMLDNTSPLLNRTIQEMAIRERTGVSIVGILRDGDLLANPGGKERFLSGDLIAIMGIREQISAFQQIAGRWAYDVEVPQDGLPPFNAPFDALLPPGWQQAGD